MVTATCETDLDSAAWGYYIASVGCVVTDGGGNTIVSGGNTDIDGELGYAQIVVSFQGIPGDPTVEANFASSGLVNVSGYSTDITAWLSAGCQPKH
jgi:hypothetical protein